MNMANMLARTLLRAVALFCLTVLAVPAQSTYKIIQSAHDPDNAIRVKKFEDGELCNGGQAHYTGWFDIKDKHLFYWFHPVRHGKMEDAPLIVWLQGGPGGSSLFGMLVEHGPCVMDKTENATRFNPYSWTELANVIYLDQPVGVGFSYLDNATDLNSYPRRTEESALDFVVSLKLLQEAFPLLRSARIHISGESYGGRYIPEYAAAVLEYNSHVPTEYSIPLSSLIIGNGWTSPMEQYPALYETGCFTVDGIAPIFNKTECDAMAAAVDRCETVIASCEQNPDELVCYGAGRYCNANLKETIKNGLYNQYNRVEVCPKLGECYMIADHMVDWLNTEVVQIMLEFNQVLGGGMKYALESEIIAMRYEDSADVYTSSLPALAKVLADGHVPVLFYNGLQDWVCNSLGMQRALERVHWDGHAEFRASPKAQLPWRTSDGMVAGSIKKAERLWFVELAGAGHLVPYDQPESAFKLLNLWLDSQGLLTLQPASYRAEDSHVLRTQS